jgi:small-conductance mechanosensitive channel
LLEEPEIWGVENMGADGIDIRMGIKTRPSEQFKVMRELRTRLKERFDHEGIQTSSPQRTMWVRDGVGDGDGDGRVESPSDGDGHTEAPSVSERDEHL